MKSNEIINCDVCLESIADSDSAMVFWRSIGTSHKVVTDVIIAHKGQVCDDETRPFSMELSMALSPIGFDRFLDFIEQPGTDIKGVVNVLHRLYFNVADPIEFARLNPPQTALGHGGTAGLRGRARDEQRLAQSLEQTGTCALCGHHT